MQDLPAYSKFPLIKVWFTAEVLFGELKTIPLRADSRITSAPLI